MGALIRFKEVKKEFKDKLVLNKLNLELNKGEIFGIIGMSGSGKTTMLNTLIGFLEPEEGEVEFFSEKDKVFKQIHKNQKEVNNLFGFATQAASFYPKLTVEENLLYFGSLYNLSKKQNMANAVNLMKQTDLYEAKNRLAQALSGGMEKKLSIACALIHSPKVLILDEPTADLDPISRAETWDLIKDIHKKGTTVIVASHLLNELEAVCDRIGLLHEQKMLASGTPDELKTKFLKNKNMPLFNIFKIVDKQKQII